MKKLIIAGTLGITALTGVGLPGVEAITANAAVQEINDTVEGKVVELNSDYLIVQSTKLNEDVTIYFDFKTDVKVGDSVKVTGKGPLFSNAFSTWLTANSIEKLELKQITLASDSQIQSNLLQNPLDQLIKRSGKVIEKSGDRVTIEQDGLEVVAIVPPKVVQQINIGDTVNIYAASFFRTPVPNSPLLTRNPIIQKNNEQNVLEKQYQKRTGKIISKAEDRVTIEQDGLKVVAIVTPEVFKLVNIGDTVNVFAPSFSRTPVPNSPLVTKGIAVVEKVNS